MAVLDYRGLTITQPQTGIQFTKTTASSSDWGGVANSTYFYDLTDNIVYYKDGTGNVLSLFTSASAGSGYVNLIVTNQSGSVTAGSMTNTNYYYIFTGAGTLALPTAVGNTNQYVVKNRYSSTITVNFTGGQNADGSTTITLQPYQALTFISDNSNYNII